MSLRKSSEHKRDRDGSRVTPCGLLESASMLLNPLKGRRSTNG